MLTFLLIYKLVFNTATSNFETCMVFHMVFFNKNANLCYHGTGSEESAREECAGNRKEQVCLSSVLKETDNKYNKVTMRNRMPIRHQR